MIFSKYNFEIKYCIEKTNSINNFFKRFNYKNEKNKNICLFIFQNKLKNVIIVTLKIIFIIIRDVVTTNTNREFINSISFRVIKIEKNDEFFFFENEKTKIVSKLKTQQFCCNKIRAMYKNKNYYENFNKNVN